MTHQPESTERIVIVGGGFAGLSAAVRLAQAGLPVTVLEKSMLGDGASTRNQGWLHSGAWFARSHPDLARQCYTSLQRTLAFCPDSVEADYDSMIYFSSEQEVGLSGWMQAWDQVGIPYKGLSRDELLRALPTVDPQQIHAGVRLPDRSFRPDVVLSQLAAAARNAGAEIRPDTFVSGLLADDRRVYGVGVGANEEIRARLVILATGAYSQSAFSQVFRPIAGCQSDYQLVCLKTQLRAIRPETGCDPFCVVDAIGLNHLPHQGTSIFGTSRWRVVTEADDEQLETQETDIFDTQLQRIFRSDFGDDYEAKDWAGTTVQAMHLEQIEPGDAPLPTVVDHSQEPCGIENVLSIFPGRATLWAHLAERVRITVLDKLGSRPTETSHPPWDVNG